MMASGPGRTQPPNPTAPPAPLRLMYQYAILTISSSGARGERVDAGGPAIRDKLPPPDFHEVHYEIVDDDAAQIAQRIRALADAGANANAADADPNPVDLIVTTGGTGMGPRDVTPEAVRTVIDREVPGMAEAMRAETMQFTRMAMLSRSIVGIRGRTLIITLPGSPRAVGECLDVVLPVLPHALELIRRESLQDHPR